MLRCVIGVGALLFAGCVGPVRSLYPPAPASSVPVYIVQHGGMHTGLVLRQSDLAPQAWPAHLDYRASNYLEVGWGDEDGYRKDLTTGIVTKALVWSPRTVLLLDGFNSPLVDHFSDARIQIVEVKLSPEGYARLVEYIADSHALDPSGQPIRLGENWYRARQPYFLFRTCNTWVAEALRTAGCPIVPIYCATPGPLMYQVERFGRKLPR